MIGTILGRWSCCTDLQKIGQQTLYFDQDGKQVKGKIVTLSDKNIRYFDANSGEMAVKSLQKVPRTNGITLTKLEKQ